MRAEAQRAPRRRWPLWLTWFATLVVAIGIVAAWWTVGTSGGARLVLDRVASALGIGAKWQGVEGRLGGRLTVKVIEVSRPDLYVRVDDVEMDTDPLEWNRLLVRRLHVGRVEVRTATSGAAASIPVTFQPPYPVRVEDALVKELRFGVLTREERAAKDAATLQAAREAARRQDLVIHDFALKGEGDKTQWTIAHAGAKTQYGSFTVAGTLATKSPFALAATGEYSGEIEAKALRAKVKLDGTLKSFEARLDGDFAGARATGSALVQPFDPTPVRSLALQLHDVDLASYAAMPHTRITVDARLAVRERELSGPVRIENAEPGPFDRNLLPFTSGSAQVLLTAARIEASDAKLSLLGGGTASGKASFEKGNLQADLKVENADLYAFHRDLRPTRVNGKISIAGAPAARHFEVALRDARFELEGKAVLACGNLDVETVRVRHGSGSIVAKGALATVGRREFRFEGNAEHFDPAAFAKVAAGDLNFKFVAGGALADGLAGTLKAELAPSRFAGQAAGGTVDIAGDRRRIAKADIHVTLGEAKLDAKGSFGAPGDALDVVLRAPNLSVIAKPLGWPLSGSMDADAHLIGTFGAPAGRLTLKGTNLALPAEVFAKELALRAEVGAEAASPMDASLDAREVAIGKDRRSLAHSMSAQLKGTRASHRIDVAAAMTANQSFKAALEGGLDSRAKSPEWRGTLQALTVTGPTAFTLAAPASLAVAAQRVELGEATIRAEWGEAHLAVTRWTPQRVDLKGTTTGLMVTGVARALRLATVPRSTLVVAGEWDVHAADTVEGTVALKRVSGDLRVGDPPLALGLEEMTLRVDSVRGRAKAAVDIRGTHVGRLKGEATATLLRSENGWEIAPAAPVDGRFDLDVPSIDWFAAWMGPDARAGGSINAHVILAGTGADPVWSGNGRAEDLKLREPQSGFEIEQGRVAMRVRDRAIVIEQFTAATPWHPSEAAQRALGGALPAQSGTITAEGSIDLAAGSGLIRIKGDKVPVTQLPMRFVALSGEAQLEGRKDGVLVTGALKTDVGWIGALATPLPTVSDDIVVVRTATAQPDVRPKDRIVLDVRLALGDRVRFTGRGLDTKLAGELRLQGEPGPGLRATGAIRTVEGTYDAYGQKLQIDHGTLTFYGSLERPAMNVLAVRRGLPVEPGVEVLGTANRPRVRLVSFPDVPEPEKLSWLVLGRGPADVSQGDAATLLAAARAILGRGGQEEDFARRFGFDDVRIGRSDTASALGALPQTTVAGRTATASAAEVVSVGKRLTKDINVVYEQGLADAEGALRLTWQITQKFQLLVRAGYLPGVDAVYRWTFR
jgi:translocation and assembly module TamB